MRGNEKCFGTHILKLLLKLMHMKIFLLLIISALNIQLFAQINEHDAYLKPQSNPTLDCDYCMCSLGVTPLDFSGKGIRIDPRYLLIDRTVNNGNSSPSTDGHYEEHITLQFSGIYSVSKKVSFLASVPYSVRSGRDDYSSPIVHTTGIGDIMISGRYTAMEKHIHNSTLMLAFQGGIKLPTGKSSEMQNGELIDPHLQIGTGSTDFILGTNFLFAKNRFALSANVLYGIKTKGRTGYRFGNDMNYDLASRYRVYQSGIGRNMIFLNAGFYGEFKERESMDDAVIDNSGGNTLYISGGIDYFLSPSVLFGLQLQKPVYYHLYGIQDGETFRVKSGVQFMFY